MLREIERAPHRDRVPAAVVADALTHRLEIRSAPGNGLTVQLWV